MGEKVCLLNILIQRLLIIVHVCVNIRLCHQDLLSDGDEHQALLPPAHLQCAVLTSQ